MLTASADEREQSHQRMGEVGWVQWVTLLQSRLTALTQFVRTRKKELLDFAAELLCKESAVERQEMIEQLELVPGVELANIDWAARALIARQASRSSQCLRE